MLRPFWINLPICVDPNPWFVSESLASKAPGTYMLSERARIGPESGGCWTSYGHRLWHFYKDTWWTSAWITGIHSISWPLCFMARVNVLIVGEWMIDYIILFYADVVFLLIISIVKHDKLFDLDQKDCRHNLRYTSYGLPIASFTARSTFSFPVIYLLTAI